MKTVHHKIIFFAGCWPTHRKIFHHSCRSRAKKAVPWIQKGYQPTQTYVNSEKKKHLWFKYKDPLVVAYQNIFLHYLKVLCIPLKNSQKNMVLQPPQQKGPRQQKTQGAAELSSHFSPSKVGLNQGGEGRIVDGSSTKQGLLKITLTHPPRRRQIYAWRYRFSH